MVEAKILEELQESQVNLCTPSPHVDMNYLLVVSYREIVPNLVANNVLKRATQLASRNVMHERENKNGDLVAKHR